MLFLIELTHYRATRASRTLPVLHAGTRGAPERYGFASGIDGRVGSGAAGGAVLQKKE
jgi:hypothetical protein